MVGTFTFMWYWLYINIISVLTFHLFTISLFVGSKKIELTVSDDASLEDLQSAIQESIGVHPKLQRLIVKGKIMREGNLTDYNIRSGDKVMLMASNV